MQWHLYAEVRPFAGHDDRSSLLEATLKCLTDLALATDVLGRIQVALTPYLSTADRPAVRVFLSFAQPTTPHSPDHDWRFFIVAPGSPATGDQLRSRLELYLY